MVIVAIENCLGSILTIFKKMAFQEEASFHGIQPKLPSSCPFFLFIMGPLVHKDAL